MYKNSVISGTHPQTDLHRWRVTRPVRRSTGPAAVKRSSCPVSSWRTSLTNLTAASRCDSTSATCSRSTTASISAWPATNSAERTRPSLSTVRSRNLLIFLYKCNSINNVGGQHRWLFCFSGSLLRANFSIVSLFFLFDTVIVRDKYIFLSFFCLVAALYKSTTHYYYKSFSLLLYYYSRGSATVF